MSKLSPLFHKIGLFLLVIFMMIVLACGIIFIPFVVFVVLCLLFLFVLIAVDQTLINQMNETYKIEKEKREQLDKRSRM